MRGERGEKAQDGDRCERALIPHCAPSATVGPLAGARGADGWHRVASAAHRRRRSIRGSTRSCPHDICRGHCTRRHMRLVSNHLRRIPARTSRCHWRRRRPSPSICARTLGSRTRRHSIHRSRYSCRVRRPPGGYSPKDTYESSSLRPFGRRGTCSCRDRRRPHRSTRWSTREAGDSPDTRRPRTPARTCRCLRRTFHAPSSRRRTAPARPSSRCRGSRYRIRRGLRGRRLFASTDSGTRPCALR